MIPLDPPGTWCLNAALKQMVHPLVGRRFLDVGCGTGGVSEQLCRAGWQGTGLDLSAEAVEQVRRRLEPYIRKGDYEARKADILQIETRTGSVDLALSLMVMEHLEEETEFVRRLAQWVRPGGAVVIGVPARDDCWGIEDETAGHLRRYDRGRLEQVLRSAGLAPRAIWSVGVPIVNLLARVGNRLVKRHESDLLELPQTERTRRSGVRTVPYKTVFPAWFRVFLNPIALQPAFWLQRLFYRTDLGLTLLACGSVPAGGAS